MTGSSRQQRSGKEKAMEGDQHKMREALVKVLRLANVTADGENWDWNNAIAENVVKVVKEALAAPPRNCDVGTAEEQWKRFDEFCIDWEESGPYGGCSDGCPCMAIKSKESDGCFGQSGCFSIWAQMPYEAEEGAGNERR